MNNNTDEKDLVLIVDDSSDTLSILNEALEKEGMETLVALEGNQALAIAQKMIPDIILLDAIMPTISGFDVCKKLKENPELRSIPVIFMTGLSDTENVVKGFEAGGIDYITKPIINSELVARIRVHLANSRLALSAQSALDLAGQYIFAVNILGITLWSTPQVNQLLDTANDNQAWLANNFSDEIKTWLEHEPAQGMNVTLLTPTQTLKVYFLGKASNNEYLLRLVHQESPNESSNLKKYWSLTNREAEVLFWIAKGKTNREIGQILGTSPRTINKHSEKIYKKLDVENRTTAAAKALKYMQH
ncbi:MAG: DNA-binding response OmpR family regulator/DNA-binding CsgD family transcriptional regulator [Cellvibrionaceae bacterium]|jgi:DNA-binding response OmpR family regulator/DNA-binding CsgD family transcriptional regulator